MGEIKQINIKNRTFYFHNDINDLKSLELNLLKIDKRSYKNIITTLDTSHLKKLMIMKVFLV